MNAIHQHSRVPHKSWRGFTLVEVLITVAILAVVVAVAVPAFTPDDRQRLNAAAMVLTSDLEFAQVWTIANPQDPLILRLDMNRTRYWIARAASPDTPIERPDTGEAYVINLGSGRAETATGLQMGIANVTARTVQFDAHGGLADFTRTPIISLYRSGSPARIRISIAPTTGTPTVTFDPGT